MDEGMVRRILSDLNRATDKHLIHKILLKIRSDLSKEKATIELFRKCDGLKSLVPLIKKPNKRLIDTTLSILANCCTEEKCVKEVLDLNIISSLTVILRTIPTQGIQCRTCRLLGNLATDKKTAKTIQESGIVNALISVLEDEENNETGTLLMVVRLVGKLWRLENFQADAFLYGIIKRILLNLIRLSLKKENLKEESPEKSSESSNPKKLQRESNQVFNSMQNNHESNSILAELKAASAVKLSQETEEFKMPDSKEKSELVLSMLKCILVACMAKNYQFSDQVKTTGSGIKCLLFYCDLESQFRAVALNIVSSLAFNPSLRYDIGSANGVDIVTKLLKSQSEEFPLTKSEYRHSSNIICLLSGDSCNRAKIRHCGGLKMLLTRLRETESQEERLMIMHALTIFCNDQMSIHLLVREGLISTLIQRMSAELEEIPEGHEPILIKKKEEPESGSVSVTPKSSQKRKGLKLESFKKKKPLLSPNCYSDPESPTTSGYSSLSNQSPNYSNYSPKSNRTADDFDSDIESGTYSPVCSDAEEKSEEKTEDKPLPEKEINIFSVIYDQIEEAEEEAEPIGEENDFNLDEEESVDKEEEDKEEAECEDVTPDMKKWYSSSIRKMLILLRDMRLRIRRVPDLAKSENLAILLKACKSIPEPAMYCQQILAFVVQDTENFVNLLQQNFVIDLYNLRHPSIVHKNCQICLDMRNISIHVLDTFSTIAESGYGRGELAHYLLTGEKEMQKHVAIVLTFIVKESKILYNLLFEHQALKVVMDEIFDESDQARSEVACLGITALSNSLNLILDEIPEKKNKFDDRLRISPYPDLEADSMVTFIVKDGERVQFKEDVLKSYSDVFNSMFSSDFQESKLKEVSLKTISSNGLRYFLQLVTHFHSMTGDVPTIESVEAALEAYELSLMYMLNDMESSLLRQIRKLVDDSSVQSIFEWSIRNNNTEMLEISIFYFLNSDLPGKRKLKMFRTANKSQYKKEWNFWIVDTIKAKCSAFLGADFIY